MNLYEQIPILIRQGLTDLEISKKLNLSIFDIKKERASFPSRKIIQKLNSNPNFKKEFIHIYRNNSLKKTVEILTNHPMFKDITVCERRISTYKKLFDVSSNMEETSYESHTDRLKGYMIRNSKSSAKRRGIYFDLKYTDFELPEHCPLLGIKLVFRWESKANDLNQASLDRIDNNKGYVKNNVLVISRLANQMKNCANFEQLEIFSENVLKLITHYKNQGALGSITDIFPDIKLKT